MSITQQMTPSNTLIQKGLEAKVSAWWQEQQQTAKIQLKRFFTSSKVRFMVYLKLTLNILLNFVSSIPPLTSYPAGLTQGRNILGQGNNMKILWLSSSVSK